MEIKHTIEILTKDIQDIEKLVRNLNNYASPPQIEIDLAMSKLRHVYDLLSLISRDAKSDGFAGESHGTTQQTPVQQDHADHQIPNPEQDTTQGKSNELVPEQVQNPVRKESTEQQQSPAPQVFNNPEQTSAQVQPTASDQGRSVENRQAATREEPVADQRQVAEQQPASKEEKQPPAPDQEQSADHGHTTAQQQPPARQVSGDPEQPSAQIQPPTPSKKVQGTETAEEPDQGKKAETKKASILAEKFASDKSINERSAPGSGTDLSSKLTGEPIDSVKRNIGINDRFLIIRELMDGNNEAFNELVQQLDTKHNFDEAYNVIQTTFPDQLEHEGVALLIRLSRRRYLSR